MESNIDGEDEIKGLFKSILGTDIKVKDNIGVTEELLFINTIKKLESSHLFEEKLFGDFGISLTQITDPLWEVIENDFSYVYGDNARETIMWYIHNRFNADGSLINLEDENGKIYKLKTPEDLWSYIKYKTK
tara:strand:- start:272 stop:667 length:396 start_codon:yes stop_codon:yes gene_type:complete